MVGRLRKTKKESGIIAARFGTNGLREEQEFYAEAETSVSMYRESTYAKISRYQKTRLNEDSGFAAAMPRVLDSAKARDILRLAFRKVREHRPITPKSLKAEIRALESQVAALEKKVRSLQKNMKALDSTKEPRRERRSSYLTNRGVNIHVTNNHAGRVAQKKRALLKKIEEINEEIRPLQELLDVKRDEFARIKPGSVGWFGENWRKEGATTAACAVVTPEEVTVRSAGDSVVLAIGRNGGVVILNTLHQNSTGQGTNHWLKPYQNIGYAEGEDSEQTHEMDQIMARLGESNPDDVRIVVATDGVYGFVHTNKLIEDVMKEVVDGVEFDDPNYAQAFAKQTADTLDEFGVFKYDDITVVSTKVQAGQTVCLGAFDGIGGGGPQSAVVSALAAESMEYAVDEVMKELLAKEQKLQTVQDLADEFGLEVSGISLDKTGRTYKGGIGSGKKTQKSY